MKKETILYILMFIACVFMLIVDRNYGIYMSLLALIVGLLQWNNKRKHQGAFKDRDDKDGKSIRNASKKNTKNK